MRIKSKIVPAPPPPPAPIVEDTVILEMTYTQATVLSKMMGHIGGDPDGPRKVVDQIMSALARVGIVDTDFPDEYSLSDSMYFVKTPNTARR